MLMEKIIKVERNHFGEIINFQTSSGRIISYQKALNEIEAGVISGVEVQENELGASYIVNENDDRDFSNYPPIFQ
ncbi:DUF3892 domain-containing protein [Bacillus ginsengihumi]|uniref:DUF3892 domain-containing protein n=2 Tax=Heyndrickxia ginsengihumi TaxID=363870 RepID=A0A0A6VHF8_9BACI|nr:hypothetical protein NG54_05455 [Heyndrickxia ginsengihumi]MBE6184935.1 DUF3892 domain-containing protein [Bacillus sp. (in: firmicutes)]NEY20356.1 DUF3892 domain-containing protein [Heyndrickxia ginsengihumi]